MRYSHYPSSVRHLWAFCAVLCLAVDAGGRGVPVLTRTCFTIYFYEGVPTHRRSGFPRGHPRLGCASFACLGASPACWAAPAEWARPAGFARRDADSLHLLHLAAWSCILLHCPALYCTTLHLLGAAAGLLGGHLPALCPFWFRYSALFRWAALCYWPACYPATFSAFSAASCWPAGCTLLPALYPFSTLFSALITLFLLLHSALLCCTLHGPALLCMVGRHLYVGVGDPARHSVRVLRIRSSFLLGIL